MRGGFKIGRIAGINIYVDWSWLLILALVTWNLAAGVFPSIHPQWGVGLDWAVAGIAALLFFVSVLAHEVAHSIVARRNGVPVRNITLFLFGGVSNIQREPPSPWLEVMMAIVGPLTSLVLGVIFLVSSGVLSVGLNLLASNPLPVLAQLDPLSSLLLWLGLINILLAIFNLIPGFPLDGGRVLRSILWAATGNLRRATQWASGVGQLVGWALILAGISMIFGVTIPFLGTGLISGIWLLFIGWFLNEAAVRSDRQVVIEDMLEGVPVQELMRPNVPTVPPNIPINALLNDYILRTEEHAFPVVEGNRLLGLVCLEDVRQVPQERRATTLVNQIMTPVTQLTVATPREDAAEALNELAVKDVRQLPVVQNGALVGMLRRRDIMRWLQLHSDRSQSPL